MYWLLGHLCRFFFFFKQKTAYEMRISDWSSDVCSSDLQLDYWARTSLVVPSIRGAAGSGSQRLYSFKDILVLKIVKRLLDTGISLQNIRVAVDHFRKRGVRDLAHITMFSDGTTVYECTSPDEVVDLLDR